MRNEVIAWACISLILIAAETVAPGVFMLWLGIAAAVVFAVVLMIPGIPLIWQAAGFIVLSFVSIAVYRRYYQKREELTDQPFLNRRAEQLIGRVFALETAIANGSGRIKMGDALWTVAGPDLPAGAMVRVIGTDGMSLKVQPAD